MKFKCLSSCRNLRAMDVFLVLIEEICYYIARRHLIDLHGCTQTIRIGLLLEQFMNYPDFLEGAANERLKPNHRASTERHPR
jgi:hypothetical protein